VYSILINASIGCCNRWPTFWNEYTKNVSA